MEEEGGDPCGDERPGRSDGLTQSSLLEGPERWFSGKESLLCPRMRIRACIPGATCAGAVPCAPVTPTLWELETRGFLAVCLAEKHASSRFNERPCLRRNKVVGCRGGSSVSPSYFHIHTCVHTPYVPTPHLHTHTHNFLEVYIKIATGEDTVGRLSPGTPAENSFALWAHYRFTSWWFTPISTFVSSAL